MNRNSTIKPKIYCECKEGCKAYKTFGFGKFNYAHAPAEMKEAKGLKAKKGYQNRLSKARKANLSKKVITYAKSINAVKSPKNKSKLGLRSDLLKRADKLFGGYIKKKDTMEGGYGECPCCQMVFHIDDKNSEGETMVNAMHFIDRSVYSLRYEERQVYAGHSWCNANQHNNPTGKEYKNFKAFLIKEWGKPFVDSMELQHREINKLSNQDIKNIIALYSPKK